MSRRSIQAFSLLEALAMIVTLFVFGWLCVGVVRYDLKHQDIDPHATLKFTTKDGTTAPIKEDKSPVAPVKAADPAADKTETAPAGASQPAGSPAPVKP